MERLNSYVGMADNDYAYAKCGIEVGDRLGNYNGTASIAAQAAEKYLKAVIEMCFTDDADAMDLLHSHNLRSLYNKIILKFELHVSSKDCKWLGDFYFDARYPGDNFVTVNKEDAEECLRLLDILSNDVHRILEDEEVQREKQRQILGKLKAF
ncbi:HEPN domain-containing protein [Acetivibrio ethanolgignens]|uniref:HEPN domain-containing protein n=1 Tax=Acetivibrio ethanolgignens TaxID=290052 RepID=A0A0V8QDV6_9FIRM|nr:HEPN domain-containing protein [Acetivibrio ethanolgignens]KSV58738.1 hypothetical protein ASU35_11790 [Acetivibrio ethanolgignens]